MKIRIPEITPFDRAEWQRLVDVDEALARGDVPEAIRRFLMACALGMGLICFFVFFLLPLLPN
jgi:hypothetical protein